MPSGTVAIVSPGDMGHNVGKALKAEGLRIVTCLAGRSERTRTLAGQAGFENIPSLEEMLDAADLVVSIMPPARALEAAKTFAAALKRAGKAPPYADCNATSPQTSRQIGDVITAAGVAYIDGGIIGTPPGRGANPTRFYVSGPAAAAMAILQGPHIKVVDLGDEIGRASAIKMCYAGFNKATWALHAAALLTAERFGVSDEFHGELRSSQPRIFAEMERMVPRLPLDAERWIGEMHEIAATFDGVGVTPHFHVAAAEIFELMAKTPIAEETRETVDETRTLKQALDIYTETLPSLRK